MLASEMSARRPSTPTNETSSVFALDSNQSTLHVFHIDDSSDDHLLLKAAAELASVPFTWDVAESADVAIFYLGTLLELREKSSVRWPDLVLLDVSLPRGGGFKVLKFIRAIPELSTLRVVVLSGSDEPGISEQAYHLGANSVFSKPAAFRDLVKLAASLHATSSTGGRLSPILSRTGDEIHLMVQ
jgi:CheY-like chemotaxis protein